MADKKKAKLHPAGNVENYPRDFSQVRCSSYRPLLIVVSSVLVSVLVAEVLLITLLPHIPQPSMLKLKVSYLALLVSLLLFGLHMFLYRPFNLQITRLTRSKNTLLYSEQRLLSITDSTTNALIMVDGDGRVTYWNHAARKLFGYRKEEILGRDLHRFIIPEEQRKKYLDGLSGFKKSGEGAMVGRTVELTGLRKNGQEFPVELSLTSVQLGNKWHALGTVRDITDRQGVAVKLRMLQRSVESGSEAVIMTDVEGGVFYVNPAFKLVFGYTPDEVIGKNLQDILQSSCHDNNFYKNIWNTIFSGKVWQGEITNICKKEQIFYALTTITPVFLPEEAKIAGFVMVQYDITKKKRAEEALRRSEELYRTLIENTAEGICHLDLDGKIIYLNPAEMKLNELKNLDEVRNLYCTTGVKVQYKGHMKKAFEKAKGNEPAHLDYMIATSAGQERWLKAIISPVNNADGNITSLIRITRDITERKLADEQREELITNLDRVNAELQNFAYVVSHDLKAPLRAISSLASWIKKDYEKVMDEEGLENLELLIQRTRRMNKLIDGILQYSRLGRTKQVISHVDCQQVFDEVVDSLSPPEGISIRVENTLPKACCDVTHVTQVFQNLISNSIKYMGKPEGEVVLSCREIDKFLEFSVRDTGIGIDERHHERIFKIFQTLEVRDKRESTGIGLTLVKKIVEQYNGSIRINSKAGEGSEFIFTLPNAEACECAEKDGRTIYGGDGMTGVADK